MFQKKPSETRDPGYSHQSQRQSWTHLWSNLTCNDKTLGIFTILRMAK